MSVVISMYHIVASGLLFHSIITPQSTHEDPISSPNVINGHQSSLPLSKALLISEIISFMSTYGFGFM